MARDPVHDDLEVVMQVNRSTAVAIARARVPALLLGVAAVLTSPLHRSAWIAWIGVGLIASSVLSTFLRGVEVRAAPMVVESPVVGRWVAVNSPAESVPSHGVHSAGQTYAIDLVHWPDPDEEWKAVHAWPLMRSPEDFPGFGQPVSAPADGRVVKAVDRWRDHRSRNSWPALLYAFVEGSARELLGPGALLGNHVILDLGDGTYAVLAHLRRRSVTVTAGDVVRRGQQVGECGNSGNTSEPHLHFQLMDRAHPSIAAGLPFALAGHDLPRNQEALEVPVR